MPGKLTTIYPDGRIEVENVESPELEPLQEKVQGSVQVIPLFETYEGQPCVAFCNEEGKIYGLPRNPIAQIAWEKALGRPIHSDYLNGAVVIVQGDDEFMEKL